MNQPTFYTQEFEPIFLGGAIDINPVNNYFFGVLYPPYGSTEFRRLFPEGALSIIHHLDRILIDGPLPFSEADFHVSFPHIDNEGVFNVDVWCFTFPGPESTESTPRSRQVTLSDKGVTDSRQPTAEEEIVLGAESDLYTKLGKDLVRKRVAYQEELILPLGLVAPIRFTGEETWPK